MIVRLSGLGNVTDSALSKIFGVLSEEGALAEDLRGTSRSSLSKVATQKLEALTAYGQVLQNMELPLATCGNYSWWFVHPFAILNYFAQQDPKFCEVLYDIALRIPSSPQNPWHIAWYLDEACPGNLLSVDQGRKSQLIYWTSRQLGSERLSKEANWMLGGVVKSSECGKL